jgi:hypothetical protein
MFCFVSLGIIGSRKGFPCQLSMSVIPTVQSGYNQVQKLVVHRYLLHFYLGLCDLI